MGRKKSPVTRKCIGQRHVDPTASGSSLSASERSDLLGDVSPSSLRGLAAVKQEPTAMDTESSDSLQLPFQSMHTALPIGGEARGRRQKSRRKRRSSGDDAVTRQREESEDSSDDDNQEEEEEMVTISVAELEKWQQRVIFHVEDHFTNEQLKRIAEFGRVHGSIVQEARQYVGKMEMQLKNQLEEERAALRAHAEEFVAKTAAENESLQQQVTVLERQVEGLEKQVDTLEQQVDTLTSEKAESTRQQAEDRRGCRKQLQQTHSPLNQRTQVQQGNEEINGSAGNHPAGENHDANGYGQGESCGAALLHAAKQTGGGMVEHCSASKPINSTHHQDSRTDKDHIQPHQQPTPPRCNDLAPANGIQPNPGAGVPDGPQIIKYSETPAASGGQRTSGGSG